MTREGTAAWYYEQAIRLRVLATKAINPRIQSELLQAATRFRTLAADAEARAGKKRHARESMAAAFDRPDFERANDSATPREPVAAEAKR